MKNNEIEDHYFIIDKELIQVAAVKGASQKDMLEAIEMVKSITKDHKNETEVRTDS